MASILRSGKFLRYVAGSIRHTAVKSVRLTDLLRNSPCVCSHFHKGFANAVPKADFTLEKQLKRLDQDVRRVGRISRRDIENVLEEIRLQRSATSSQSLLLIRCCGNLVPEEMPEVRTALVKEIWKTLNTHNVPMDISHYNALLRVYLENEHPFSPTDFLAEIKSRSIEPNRVTYQRLIARYCQQGDIEGATRILEFMREKNLPVNENVFNSLILGHSQANDMESAKGILTVMKQAGLEPSAETYSTILCCYARHGDIDAVISTINECEKNEIYLLDKDLLDIVYNLSINDNIAKVEVVLEKLRFSAGFNQDAVNTILRLVNNGYEDVGLKILRLMPRSTRSDGQLMDAGTFFIKQLLKANRPIEKILSICKTMTNEGLHSKALIIAAEAGLTNGRTNSALTLLKEMKNSGLPIRQHYFWPIICTVESHQIINIIRHIREEFEILPNSETLRDYVIPNFREKNWDKIINLLRDSGISSATAASSAAFAALSMNQIEDAATIMESYKAFYPPLLFKQPMIQTLAKTNNYAAFTRIVRQINDSVNRVGKINNNEQQNTKEQMLDTEGEPIIESEESTLPTSKNQSDFVGRIVIDTYAYFRQDSLTIVEQLLEELVQHGLSMSSKNATHLSELIGSAMTPHISKLLEKLSSGELEPVPLRNNGVHKRSVESMTVEELERFIANVESRQESATNLKKHLLMACFRSKNLTKTLQVISQMESENFKLYSGVWAQLIDLYTHHGKLTEALDLYEKVKTNDENFVIDNIKTVRIVELLLNEDRLDDALCFLERNKKSQPFSDGEGSFNYITIVWRIMNKIADTGNEQKLQKIFDAFIQNNYIIPKNVLLGPLIKVHMVRDDLQKAMEVFEYICETYKTTPWKNELACRLIQNEDAANLQKLTDLSTTIHGEVNSLYDLVFSFIECGRIRQARKILETQGLRARPHRIDNACERYKNQGMIPALEGLVEATRDLYHIDRNNIYYNLLLSYYNIEDIEKALGLWTKMQEESITPTDAFLNKLAEFLEKKNLEIPFVVPEMVKENIEKFEISEKQPQLDNISLIRKAIRTGDLETAIQLHKNLKENQQLNITDLSHLIELLVRADRLSEATKYINDLLEQKHYPKKQIFKFYLNKVAATGDVKTMQHVNNQLTNEEKKLVSFDNRFCHAYIMAGRIEEYMKLLLDNITNAKSADEVAKLGDQFPRGGALGILEKHPEMAQKFEEIAELYAKHNILGPMNVLWMHLIMLGDEEASKSIWNKYLKNSPRVMFHGVLKTAREEKNEKLAERLISHLRSSKISEGAVGNAYSCLIDIQIANENYEDALLTLNEALKDVCLENINRTALERLKVGLEKQNKQFPYTIPVKRSQGQNALSSSTSSSDDDVTPKRPEAEALKAQH